MASTAKGDDRKQEFLSTALDLFYEKGYEKTTIQDIIDRMGVSKGAFYHYFESKEDVIVSIAEEFTERAIRIIKEITERIDLTSIEKLNKVIDSVNKYKENREEQRSKIKNIFANEGNLKLERKIMKSIKNESINLFKKIIDEGIKDGLIETVNSKELAEAVLYNIHNLNTSIDELLIDLSGEGDLNYQEFRRKLEEKLQFYEELFGRILNLKSGSINLKESYIKRFAK